MEAGREMDVLVAKAIGKPAIVVCPECEAAVTEGLFSSGIRCTRPCGWKIVSSNGLCPNYSTDIAAAWTILEHFVAKGSDVYLSRERVVIEDEALREKSEDGLMPVWIAMIESGVPGRGLVTAHADHPALAICHAALEAVGVEV